MIKFYKQAVTTKFIFNPFIWFILVWSGVFFIHSLNLSSVYPPLSPSMGIVFLILLLVSILLAVLYHKFFLNDLKFSPLKNSRASFPFIFASYIILIAEILYSKQIPILATLHTTDIMSYQEFGIPTVTFLNTSFVFFIAITTSVKIVYGDKKNRFKNLIVFALCLLRFLLLYSRGALLFCGVTLLLAFISKRKITVLLVISIIVIAVIGMFAFNALGNIRLGSKWNDSSEFIKIAKVNAPSFLNGIIWPLMYLDSPLGNLLYFEANIGIEYSEIGLFSQLLPDFLSKRLFPDFTSTLVRPIYAMTVSSMFAGSFKYFGYIGIFASYFEFVLVTFITAGICKKNKKYLIASSIGLVFISALSFFDNMVTFSGYSFYLLFIIIAAICEKSDEVFLRKEKIKLFLQYSFAKGKSDNLLNNEIK